MNTIIERITEAIKDILIGLIYISTKCEEIRSKWSDKYYNTETWPMFDIGVTEDKEKTTLHLSFDFLIADWASIWTLLIEFETIYYNKGKLYLSMWQKYIKELRYLSKNTFMEIVIFRMELHKM